MFALPITLITLNGPTYLGANLFVPKFVTEVLGSPSVEKRTRWLII